MKADQIRTPRRFCQRCGERHRLGRRLVKLLILALGIALGVVAALWLVFWRSGAEPETEPVGMFV